MFTSHHTVELCASPKSNNQSYYFISRRWSPRFLFFSYRALGFWLAQHRSLLLRSQIWGHPTSVFWIPLRTKKSLDFEQSRKHQVLGQYPKSQKPNLVNRLGVDGEERDARSDSKKGSGWLHRYQQRVVHQFQTLCKSPAKPNVA